MELSARSELLRHLRPLVAVYDSCNEVSHLVYLEEKRAIFIRYQYRPSLVFCFYDVDFAGVNLHSGEIANALREKLEGHERLFAVPLAKYLTLSAVDRRLVPLPPRHKRP